MGILDGFLDGLRPIAVCTVSEWADKHRYLSPIAAAEPGRWRTNRTPYLRQIMDSLSDYSTYKKIIVMKGAQLGLALDINTNIPTPSGFKKMGDLEIGDIVFNELGEQCNVTFTSEIMYNHKCYNVEFNDGSSIIADEFHKWEVTDDLKNKKIICNTKYMVGNVKYRDTRNRFAIDIAKPIICDEAILKIPPYVLGCWLGDGNSHSNRITTDIQDMEEMKHLFHEFGVNSEICTKHSKGKCAELVLKKDDSICARGHLLKEVGQLKNGTCYECHKIRSRKGDLPKIIYPKFGDLLSYYNLFKNKHIPSDYMRASFKQRLELVRGMMDTDGSVSKDGYCEWSCIDKNMATQFKELLCSLEIKPYIKLRKGKETFIDGKSVKSKPIYRITFHSFYDMSVFNLKRKKDRLKNKSECRIKEVSKRRIINIEEVESRPVKCIQVDSPSHLYLASECMIPTHNTEAGNNWLGYIIDNSPAPTLMVQPTEDMVKRNSKMRIDTMIDSSPNLRNKVSKSKSKSGGNTINQKNFPNGILLMAGANAPSGLRSVPVKNIFLDEVDAYPSDLGGEGSPIDLAIARTRTFEDKKKIFIISTPTIKGASVVEAEFLKTDQNYFFVPCPFCGCYHTLEFENLRWDKSNYRDTKIMCPECGELISDSYKPKMLKAGIWKPKNESKVNSETIGFHISSLYSPRGWHSWGNMAKDYDDAKDDPAKMKTFINTELGETTEEAGDRPEWRNIYNKRELYSTNTINPDVCFLTCGVDIQKDRIELEIVGWCADKQSYSIDFRVLLGNTTLQDVWLQLESILEETWERPDGISLSIVRMCVDSGYNTSEVYDFCRKNSPRAIAIKGQNQLGMAFAPPRQVDYNRRGQKIGKAKQWNIGVSFLKAEFYSWITLDPSEGVYPPRYCHFPQYDERYFEGLISEEFLPAKNKWIKKYERNEPLDTRIYARAAAAIVGLDSKSKEKLTEIGGFVIRQKVEKEEKTEKTNKNRAKAREFWGK